MIKLLIFIRKNADDSILSEVESVLKDKLCSLSKKSIRFINLEGGLLSVEKYFKYAEVHFDSKNHMNEIMQTPEGKEFNKFVSNYHNLISVFFANYED